MLELTNHRNDGNEDTYKQLRSASCQVQLHRWKSNTYLDELHAVREVPHDIRHRFKIMTFELRIQPVCEKGSLVPLDHAPPAKRPAISTDL